MKRLYIILMSMAMLLMWFTFAADFDVSMTPNAQNAISGTVVSFDISVSNNTGVSAHILQELPFGVEYINSNETPDNNPGLSMWFETNPVWTIEAWETLNIHVEAINKNLSFLTLDVLSNIIDVNDITNIYTSAVVYIDPIADIVVEKTLISAQPQLTWDVVVYNIHIENIWSATATGISFVDVRPSHLLNFSNHAFIDGVWQIPTIYDSLANNYLFTISDLSSAFSVDIEMEWVLSDVFLSAPDMVNDVFVLVDSVQYDTENDTSSVVSNVRWVSDLYVNVVQTTDDPVLSWDEVGYMISYGNSWTDTAYGVVLRSILSGDIDFVSTSFVPYTQTMNEILYSLVSLAPGESGTILLTGVFNWNVVYGFIQNDVLLTTTGVEFNYTNNGSVATGEMQELSDMSVELYANNFTDSSRNFNTGIQIFAISGDIVELQIVINNDGNMSKTWTISISNIVWFVNYMWVTSWNVNLAAWDSQIINLTWVVGPQNYISFTPVANLSYDNLLETDDVIIQEPLECGDGLITQWEPCDVNGQIWDMLPWQYCEEQNGQCVIVTEDIINTVCMEYITDIWTGEQCVSVTVPYEESVLQAQCSQLSSQYGVVIVDEDNDGEMQFTCDTVDSVVADEITINCGNGDIWTAYATSSFIYDCNYEYDEDGDDADNIYEVVCVVNDNDDVSEDCRSSVRVDEWFYGVCGDGTMDDGEECDLGWNEDEEIDIDDHLDLDEDYDAGRYEDSGYYCEDCRIRESDDDFVYQIPQCLMTNTTISVMDNELMPFRWRLWDRDNMKVRNNYDCDDVDEDETKTIIDRDSLECTFAVYNWVDYLQEEGDEVNKFTVNCFEEEDSVFFDYFEEEYRVNFDKVSGRYIKSVNSLLDGDVSTYGEYKLVLEKVEYEYCNPDTQEWEDGRLYEGVCEVNFALTRPYMMQISTFGIDPIATDASDFLKDFYDINGNSLIKSADIDSTMSVEARDYGFDSNTAQQMSEFKSRYESLAIVVDNNFEIRDGKTIWDLFNNAEVKKVPNQLIFFVDWNGQLTLKQLTEYFPGAPFTIYVEGMDVIVEWSVKTNGMIVTDQKIYFEDDSVEGYCQYGWQVVQWIFVAQWWFDADDRLRNQSDQQRCQRWNLQVKWVLIWDGIESLMDNRRSHLNDWFQVDSNLEASIKRERRQEIFEWAALLIEYNPELWGALPPGAESFTQSLDVYRN